MIFLKLLKYNLKYYFSTFIFFIVFWHTYNCYRSYYDMISNFEKNLKFKLLNIEMYIKSSDIVSLNNLLWELKLASIHQIILNNKINSYLPKEISVGLNLKENFFITDKNFNVDSNGTTIGDITIYSDLLIFNFNILQNEILLYILIVVY